MLVGEGYRFGSLFVGVGSHIMQSIDPIAIRANHDIPQVSGVSVFTPQPHAEQRRNP